MHMYCCNSEALGKDVEEEINFFYRHSSEGNNDRNAEVLVLATHLILPHPTTEEQLHAIPGTARVMTTVVTFRSYCWVLGSQTSMARPYLAPK